MAQKDSVEDKVEAKDFADLLLKYILHPSISETWVFRSPCETFFAFLAAVKGIPAVFGINLTINGPETNYPSWLLVTWGIQLTLSSFCIFYGLWVQKETYSLRILGFKLLTLATFFNLLGIACTDPTRRLSYSILYIGFLICSATKVLALSHMENLIEAVITNVKINGNGNSTSGKEIKKTNGT